MELFVGREIKKTQNLIFRLLDAKQKKPNQKGIKLTFPDRQICMYLYDNKIPVYQRDIEKEFSLRRSSASAQLKKMEKKGLIKRVTVSEDKRLKRITLTKKAKDGLEESLREMVIFENILSQNLSEDEKVTLCNLLKKIQDNILNLAHDKEE